MAAAPTSVWLRAAAVSGASAVALGAYGAHGFHPADPKYTNTFNRGNQYHLIHSLLLAAAPFARFNPVVPMTSPIISRLPVLLAYAIADRACALTALEVAPV